MDIVYESSIFHMNIVWTNVILTVLFQLINSNVSQTWTYLNDCSIFEIWSVVCVRQSVV